MRLTLNFRESEDFGTGSSTKVAVVLGSFLSTISPSSPELPRWISKALPPGCRKLRKF